MKIPDVTIHQFGQNWDIFINGKQKDMRQVSRMCNAHMRLLRQTLNKRDRERRIREWLMKAKAGVDISCKTHWYGGTPMWIPYVTKKAGVSRATASYRIINWKQDGDMKRLMRPISTKTADPPKPKPVVVKPVHAPRPVIVPREIPTMNPLPAPTGRGFKIAPKPEPLTDTPDINDGGDWGDLSNKPRTGNLKNIPGPTEYERNL